MDTFDLLYKYEKYDDCERLLTPALNMLVNLRSADDHNASAMIDTKSKNS